MLRRYCNQITEFPYHGTNNRKLKGYDVIIEIFDKKKYQRENGLANAHWLAVRMMQQHSSTKIFHGENIHGWRTIGGRLNAKLRCLTRTGIPIMNITQSDDRLHTWKDGHAVLHTQTQRQKSG